MQIRTLIATLLIGAGCVDGAVGTADSHIPEWSATAELVIGNPQAAEYRFLEPTTLLQTEGGEILTLHAKERRIRAFDPGGRFLRDVAGPEALSAPVRMDIRGDTAWVLDQGPSREFRGFRISDGAAEGRLPAAERNAYGAAPEVEPPVRAVGILPDGTYLAMPHAAARDHVKKLHTDRVFLRMTRDGLILDTLAVLTSARSTIGFPTSDGTGGVYSAQPFGDDPIFAVSPTADLVFVLHRQVPPAGDPGPSPRFRLLARTFAGETRLDRDYTYSPVPLPNAWVRQAVRSWQAVLGMAYSHSEPLIRERLYVPTHQPSISEMKIGADGRIWLRRWDVTAAPMSYGLARWAPDQAQWLVLSPNGELLGSLQLPTHVRWLHADRTKLWGTYSDLHDGAKIIRYRLCAHPDPSELSCPRDS
ncbi:hypothetical protein BH23GEM3_BH23GEM3_11130 [soil metagenome]